MKKNINIFIFLATVIVFLCIGSASAFADDPYPPTVPGDHGHAGDVPVGAPIDGGLYVLLILGAGYGAKKLYTLKNVKVEKTVEMIKVSMD